MAGERRQSARQNQTPERVQQAAQAMNYSAPSGVQRGYVPQNTGGYPPQNMGGFTRQTTGGYPPQNTGGFTRQTTGGYPPQQAGGYNPAGYSGYQQRGQYSQPSANRNAGGMQYVSSTGAGMRGFSIPAPEPKKKREKKTRSRTPLILTIVFLSLAAMIGAGLGIKYMIDKNRDEQIIR